MSRIHEALQKARMHKTGSAEECPDVDEVIAAAATVPAPRRAWTARVEGVLSPVPDSATDPALFLANCPQSNWPSKGENLIFLGGEAHAACQEQFRTLRSRLYQMRDKSPLKVIVVSSSIPNEGKSFVSANLAHIRTAMQSSSASDRRGYPSGQRTHNIARCS